ncbi:MAG: radical SAM protein [Ruminococcaceae bacterium]|nr:radical SAM protein [Oscillospiraceae bacterium]
MSVELSLKSIYIEITNKCNLFCKHCYNDSKYNNNTFLSYSTLENIYKSFFEEKPNQIAISGGEPLLHPEILNIFSLALRYKVQTQIVTNGVLLDRYVEDIISNPYLTVQISIDGVGESHNLLRSSHIFDHVNSNIDKLRKKVPLSINTSLNKYNLFEIENIVKYAIDKGAKTIAFSPLNFQGRATQHQDIQVSNHELRNAIDLITKLSTEYQNHINIKPIKINYSSCPFSSLGKADISPRIDVNGNVFLCSMFTNTLFSIGNINQENLFDIINGARCNVVTDFLHSFKNLIDCKSCVLNNECQRGCLAQYLNDLPAYFDDCCKLKKSDFWLFLKNTVIKY